MDFFGRTIIPKETHQSIAKAARKANVYRVSYKFNEGNSAAVRKPVKVSAFL